METEMIEVTDNSVSERFVDEEIASHWLVDKGESSFIRLLEHIQVNTHFYHGFYKAFLFFLSNRPDNNMTVADIGGGVGWTSALMAKHPRIKKVYLVEPSSNRSNSFQYICKHWKVDPNKIVVVDGTFNNFSLPEKVDAIVMCASIHHCHSDNIENLFSNIHNFLIEKNGVARVLIVNEHYVNILFSLRRQLTLLKWLYLGKKPFWSVINPRHYHPSDFEHWRTKSELNSIFEKFGYKANYKILNVDLCDDKSLWAWLMMWRYYYATLDFNV